MRGQKTGSAFLCLPVLPTLLRGSRISGSASLDPPDGQRRYIAAKLHDALASEAPRSA